MRIITKKRILEITFPTRFVFAVPTVFYKKIYTCVCVCIFDTYKLVK